MFQIKKWPLGLKGRIILIIVGLLCIPAIPLILWLTLTAFGAALDHKVMTTAGLSTLAYIFCWSIYDQGIHLKINQWFVDGHEQPSFEEGPAPRTRDDALREIEKRLALLEKGSKTTNHP